MWLPHPDGTKDMWRVGGWASSHGAGTRPHLLRFGFYLREGHGDFRPWEADQGSLPSLVIPRWWQTLNVTCQDCTTTRVLPAVSTPRVVSEHPALSPLQRSPHPTSPPPTHCTLKMHRILLQEIFSLYSVFNSCFIVEFYRFPGWFLYLCN